MRYVLILTAAFMVACSNPLSMADDKTSDGPDHWIRHLHEFGPSDRPEEARQTWQKAQDAFKGRAGVLVVPAHVWPMLKPDSLQSLTRIPDPPAETKQWKQGHGLSVLTADRERPVLHVPPLSGLKLERELRLNDGDSLPHWGTHPMLLLESRLIYGSISYLDWLQAPTEKGTDRRFYVPTVRGLVPGQFLNVHGGPGYGGGVTRAVVKSLGYDAKKKLFYFVADTSLDHIAGGIAQNKSNTGLIHMTQTSHADNQTYDVKVIRNQYAHGDTYIYYCDFNYMSNIHSAAGDENGNCYGAFIRSKDNNFRGTVEAIHTEKSKLTFAHGASNITTLGNSRPLINLNPEKHITQGKVLIVTGRSEFDLPDAEMSVFEDKDYSTGLIKNPIHGATERKFGGLIRGNQDCPWTEDVLGRYFTVNEKSEKTPKGNHRWYLITKFKANEDGTKEIEIERFWWGAKSAGSPTLYRLENYTRDGHVQPLSYIIAPGAYVNDVSRAVSGGNRGGQRLLGLAPSPDKNKPTGFAPGDRIEQAIGPDPFKPQAMRVWMWEDVPGQFPSAVFDVANYGAVSRYSVLSVAGGPANLDELSKRHEPKPAWDNIIVLNSAATIGLNLKADFAKAAILFQQPNREQPIKWHYGQAMNKDVKSNKTGITRAVSAPATSPKVASLTVNRTTGVFQFDGGGVQAGGSISKVSGLSGEATPSRNLRGKNVFVQTGESSKRIEFPQPEANNDYAVFIEQSWLSNRAVSEKTPEGFTVTFAAKAPEKAMLDWMLVR
ncbi:MAG: hypothetical protein O3A82_03035 [Verrucomicrobia bacterium]|nr:hypothetical protein [Verrucomicrobiota bacterium]